MVNQKMHIGDLPSDIVDNFNKKFKKIIMSQIEIVRSEEGYKVIESL